MLRNAPKVSKLDVEVGGIFQTHKTDKSSVCLTSLFLFCFLLKIL